MQKTINANYVIMTYKSKGYSKKEVLKAIEAMYMSGKMDPFTYHIMHREIENIYDCNE